MPLPTINAVNPINVDAQPAQTFDDAFLTQLIFQANSPQDKWSLSMSCKNYNASTGQVCPVESGHSTTVDDVASYASQFPVFAQCLGTVLVVAGLVQNHKAAQLALMDATTSNDATKISAAQTALTNAERALGKS
jgi:hypothetical protein